MTVQQHEAIRSAYAQLLRCADSAFRTTNDELAAARTASAADPAHVQTLEAQLLRTTELIDLLESAVAQAIDILSRPVHDAAGHR